MSLCMVEGLVTCPLSLHATLKKLFIPCCVYLEEFLLITIVGVTGQLQEHFHLGLGVSHTHDYDTFYLANSY